MAMDWNNPQTLKFLSQCFHHTFSPLPSPRRAAESSLSDAADHPNFALAVLRLLFQPSLDPLIRLSASVHFKNHLKRRWNPNNHKDRDRDQVPEVSMISDSEKEQIKALIVPLMLSSDPKIRAQLGEALAVIGQHDFPGKWPGLLPELVRKLGEASEGNDYRTVNGILGTANALFKRFRYAIKSDALYRDLKYILEGFAAPLLQVFMRTAALIDGAAEVRVGVGLDGKAPRALFESQRLCCRIFL